MGQGKIGIIDTRDVGDCIISIINNGGHVNKLYTLTGPESITFHDVASALSNSLGKTVRYVSVSPEQVADSIRNMGGNEWAAKVMTDYDRAFSTGYGNITTKEVENLTGNKPRNIQNFCNEVFTNIYKLQTVSAK
jgi:hypothetical protein